MKGCNTLQCLQLKPRNWKSEAHDQDFEHKSNYFLTGISDFMPSRDSGWPTVLPARHGVEVPSAEVVIWQVRMILQWNL
jgi:hypothetical protein